MRIERLIQIFERLLPIYEKAYSEKIDNLHFYHLQLGLCYCAYKNRITELTELSSVFDSYYIYYLKKSYIFPIPKKWQHLRLRIDFMKSEIKDLKKLLKQGYTDV